MKRISATILLTICSILLSAQNQGNFWYFGDHAGLDFSSGSPVSTSGGQVYFPDGTHSEGSASICDSSGNLLFYTNGHRVWNKNHLLMPNGTGIGGHWSSTQAALIIPQPGSTRYYYIFTTDAFYNLTLDKGLRYSVVDMCLDNGTGAVMIFQKNILVLDTVAEKLTAVRHGNGTDYWIITHKYYSDAFYAFQLSANGIVDTVISHIGSFHPTGTQNIHAAIGQLKASPDGHKLAIGNGNSNNCIAEYFDFDPLTGTVSNVVNVQWDTLNNFYGISFSPDNTKLYFACNNPTGIFQFDLTAGGGHPDSVRASRTQVGDSSYSYLGMQLGPDGKIYAARTPISTTYLSVINSPNLPGASCNFVGDAVSLNGTTASFGLPNFIDSYDYSNDIPGCITGIVEESLGDHTPAFPNPFIDQTTITFGKSVVNATIILRNALGQPVMQNTNLSGEAFVLQRNELSPGLYVVQLFEDDNLIFSKIIVIAQAE